MIYYSDTTPEDKARIDAREKERERLAKIYKELSLEMEQAIRKTEASGQPTDILTQQLDVLNATFKKLLMTADKQWNSQGHYSLALRAQNQFRKTYQMLEMLKDKGDKSKK